VPKQALWTHAKQDSHLSVGTAILSPEAILAPYPLCQEQPGIHFGADFCLRNDLLAAGTSDPYEAIMLVLLDVLMSMTTCD